MGFPLRKKTQTGKKNTTKWGAILIPAFAYVTQPWINAFL